MPELSKEDIAITQLTGIASEACGLINHIVICGLDPGHRYGKESHEVNTFQNLRDRFMTVQRLMDEAGLLPPGTIRLMEKK